MASSPLNKFGVPLKSGRQRIMNQPKLKHKFRVVFNNFGISNDDADYAVMEVDTVDRPSVSFSVHNMKRFTGNGYYVGSHEWGEIKLVIRDVVSNDSTRAVYRQLQKQLDFSRRISRRSAQQHAGYHFQMAIETLGGANPDDTISNLIRNTATDVISAITDNSDFANELNNIIGNVDGSTANPASMIDRWYCTGCVLKNISWDSMDYSVADYATITLTIQPSYCTLYDNYKAMYKERISSSMDDSIDDFLNIADSVFGAVEIGSNLLDGITSFFS